MNSAIRFIESKQQRNICSTLSLIIVMTLLILCSTTLMSCMKGNDYLIAERWYIIGSRFMDVDQPDLAIKPFTNAVEADSEYFAAWYKRGRAYCELGQCELAIHDFTTAIALVPSFAETYHDRGIAYYETGRYNLAVLDFSFAIEIDPNSINSYFARGLAYKAQSMKTEAMADFRKFLAFADDQKLIEVARIELEDLSQ